MGAKWRRNEFWYGQWLHAVALVSIGALRWVSVCSEKKTSQWTENTRRTRSLRHSCPRRYRHRPMTTLLAVILVTTSFHLAAPHLMAQPGSWLRFLSSLSIWCTLADVLLGCSWEHETLAWWSTNGCWFALLLVLMLFCTSSYAFLITLNTHTVLRNYWVSLSCTSVASALQLQRADVTLHVKLDLRVTRTWQCAIDGMEY